MISNHRVAQNGLVIITLRIDETQPPSGEVTSEDNFGTVFRGWLDLLRVLSDALKAPERPSAGEARGFRAGAVKLPAAADLGDRGRV